MSAIVKTLTQHQVEKRHVHKFPDNIFFVKVHHIRVEQPAHICVGCRVGCSRSGPPLYRQIRGGVHNEGMPQNLFPLAPTTPADAHSWLDFRPNGENHMSSALQGPCWGVMS